MATPASGSSASNIRPPAARVPGTAGLGGVSTPRRCPRRRKPPCSMRRTTPSAAAGLLKAEIKDAAGRNNKQAWLMLFDLHQVAQNRADFECAVHALHGEVRAVAAGVGRERHRGGQRSAPRAEPRAQGLLRAEALAVRRARRRDRQVRHLRRVAGHRAARRREDHRDLGRGGDIARRRPHEAAQAPGCRCGSTTSKRSRRCCARPSTSCLPTSRSPTGCCSSSC